MQLPDPRPRPLPLWLEWTIVSSLVAGTVGFGQHHLASWPQFPWLPWLGPLLGAPFVGLAQGFVLRSHLRRGKAWAKASAIGLWVGLSVGGLMVWLGQRLPSGNFSILLAAFPITAAIQGAFQAPVLRSRVQHPNRWILICALAWFVNLFPMLVFGAMSLDWLDGAIIPASYTLLNGLLSGAIVGIIRGVGLSLLLYPPSPRQPAQSSGS